MASVTSRIAAVKQPRGGYIKPSELEEIALNDGIVLSEEENVHSSIVGMVVDYLTRLCLGAEPKKAFEISLIGATYASKFGPKDSLAVAAKLLSGIKGLDDSSVVNACKLVTFDVWYRNTTAAPFAKSYKETNPDSATIKNIQTLVNRSLVFFKEYGPIVKDGFTFEPPEGSQKAYEKMIQSGKGSFGGYTATVESGDGDFLTKDTLWDFKVSKSKPTNKHTLQLLMYWIMGQHSGQEIYKTIYRLGIFNPRLNCVFLYDVRNVPKPMIEEIEKEVIRY